MEFKEVEAWINELLPNWKWTVEDIGVLHQGEKFVCWGKQNDLTCNVQVEDWNHEGWARVLTVTIDNLFKSTHRPGQSLQDCGRDVVRKAAEQSRREEARKALVSELAMKEKR